MLLFLFAVFLAFYSVIAWYFCLLFSLPEKTFHTDGQTRVSKLNYVLVFFSSDDKGQKRKETPEFTVSVGARA